MTHLGGFPADPRTLLRQLFDAAISAAQPALCLSAHLPPAPKGRTIVIGAGKASAAMAQALDAHWPGPLQGCVVTRYGHDVPCQRIGKYVINHSFILPGLIGVSTSCLVGYLLAGLAGLI